MQICNTHSRKLFKCLLALVLGLSLTHEQGVAQKVSGSAVTSGPHQTPSKRHIIICVDGVGTSTINKLREEGHFKMFGPPSQLITTFPSLTNQAISTVLRPAGAKPAHGYEDNYFDVGANKMRGGVLDRLRGDRFVRGTFRDLFDYHPSAIKSGLGYAAPPLSTYLESLSDLIRLRQKAKNNREPVFFAYTGATDSLAHLGGERFVRRFLKDLDSSLKSIIEDSKDPVVVTIFSDHGNDFRKYRRVKLKSPLKRAGFRLDNKIKDKRSVVIPQFGLIGAAVLFTHEANEQRLANVTAAIDGVDFAAFAREEVVHLVSSDGEATIEKREMDYCYSAVKGDPLQLLPVVEALAIQTKAGDRCFSDTTWFEATRETSRPDAVRRIYEGVTNGVANQANVIVNFKDGYYSGSSLLDVFAILQATHGNLGQEQSFGFVMSTEKKLPAYIRAEDLWAAIGSPVLRRAVSTSSP